MKIFALVFIIIFAIASCKVAQTQQVSENKSQPMPTFSNVNNNNEHYGYSRFTTSDKQYLGCWRSNKTEEVVEYELKFFRLTEKTIQTSKMPKPIAYIESESNSAKDYFILQTKSKNKELQPFLSIIGLSLFEKI